VEYFALARETGSIRLRCQISRVARDDRAHRVLACIRKRCEIDVMYLCDSIAQNKISTKNQGVNTES
jgi:ribosomal protein L31E